MSKRIDLYALWQLALATLNTQQSGHLRPQRNFETWVNEISREMFNEKKTQWEKSQVIDDALAISFLRSVNVKLNVRTAGPGFDIMPYPTDYAFFSSARIIFNDAGKIIELPDAGSMDCRTGICTHYVDPDDLEQEKLDRNVNYTEKSLAKVDNQRWGPALTHKLKGPSRKNPLITQFDGGFKVAPQGLGIIVLDYLKQPKDAKFAYDIDPDTDLITYDPVASEQLEWTDLVTGEFIARLKKRYGSATGQENLYAQGEAERKQTT